MSQFKILAIILSLKRMSFEMHQSASELRHIFTFIIYHVSGISKPNARENKTKKQKASGSSSFTLKEWRQAFRGQCRAPVMIPRKGGKYRMCSE